MRREGCSRGGQETIQALTASLLMVGWDGSRDSSRGTTAKSRRGTTVGFIPYQVLSREAFLPSSSRED